MSPTASALRDGALLAVLASLVIVWTLRANPRLMMRHYPKAYRAAVAPLSPRERLANRGVALILAALLFGIPLISTLALARAAPRPSPFGALFTHAYIVGMVFNLVDWLVIDELWLGLFRPPWVMLPGTEDRPFPFSHAQHARDFLLGGALIGVIALVVAAVVRRIAA
jgi:hypothetical protein